MTSEIAIMTREGIALAADSAVTVSGKKVYNSASKLFALSNSKPVGIMVYGNTQFMGIPWEIIIKEFRNDLDEQGFDRLENYGEQFLKFLREERMKFPENTTKSYIRYLTSLVFEEIKKDMVKAVKEEIQTRGEISEVRTKEIMTQVLDVFYDNFANKNNVEDADASYMKDLKSGYAELVSSMIPMVFERLEISDDQKTKLVECALLIMIKNVLPSSTSGIVIAGFGEQEIFPSIVAYKIESLIKGKLKYETVELKKLDAEELNVYIRPFAQGDEVQTFLRGIDPNFRTKVSNLLRASLNEMTKLALDKLPTVQRENISLELNNKNQELSQRFENELENHSIEKHINPILDAVSALPKSELSSMAESLINITSFKRKVTLDNETVGGPIDVAFISKGDGFIWIKRKEYYDRQLNPSALKY